MLRLIQFVAWILDKLGRKRVIMDHVHGDKEYLWRFYILGGREHKYFVLCLHRLLRSDDDFYHNHPGAWCSLVLTGGYYEEVPSGTRFRPPGSFCFKCQDSYHRVKIRHDKPVWTLFAMFKRTQDWGFAEGDFRHVPHERHLGHYSP